RCCPSAPGWSPAPSLASWPALTWPPGTRAALSAPDPATFSRSHLGGSIIFTAATGGPGPAPDAKHSRGDCNVARKVVGLDIGTTAVRAAEVSVRRGQVVLERIGQAGLP